MVERSHRPVTTEALELACGDEPVRGGRPLDGSRDSAILSAALQLVAEVGYERVTMDAIATRCRASKATMYRRWDCKASLIADALKDRAPWTPALPEGGSLRSDLINGFLTMVDQGCDMNNDVYGGLITASRRDGELAKILSESVLANERALAGLIFDRAKARGELPVEAVPDLLCEVAPAILLVRFFVTSEPVDETYITHLVDDILLPLLKPTDPNRHPPSP